VYLRITWGALFYSFYHILEGQVYFLAIASWTSPVATCIFYTTIVLVRNGKGKIVVTAFSGDGGSVRSGRKG